MRSIDNAPFGGRLLVRRVVARAGALFARAVFGFGPAPAAGFFALLVLRSVATVLSVAKGSSVWLGRGIVAQRRSAGQTRQTLRGCARARRRDHALERRHGQRARLTDREPEVDVLYEDPEPLDERIGCEDGRQRTGVADRRDAIRRCVDRSVQQQRVSNAPHRAVGRQALAVDRKSTRLNSSHTVISYAVFCLKKKKNNNTYVTT